MPANGSPRPTPSASAGSLLRQYRLAAGMTQKQLARPRYSPSYISTIELGKAKPTLRLLEWCAEQLHVSVPELLGDETIINDRSQRQRVAEASYLQAYAEMLLAAGETSEAGPKLRALQKRSGAKASKTLLWLNAYVAYLDGDLDRARADLHTYGSPLAAEDNPLETAAYHWLQGLIADREGAFSRAVDEQIKALSTGAVSFIAPDFAIGVRASLTETYLRAHQLEQAYDTQSDALRLYERLRNPLRHAEEARRLAEAAAKTRDFARAGRLMRWAETMYREARMMRQVFNMCLRHALLPPSASTRHTPERDLQLALTIAQRLDQGGECELVTALLVLLRLKQGDLEQAKRYAYEALIGGAVAAGHPSPIAGAIVTLAHAALAHADSRDEEALVGLQQVDAALAEAGDVSETDLPPLLFAYQEAVRLVEAMDRGPEFIPLMRHELELRAKHGL